MANTKIVDFNKAAEIITRHFHENGFDVSVMENDIDWQGYVEQWEMISYHDPSNNYWTKFFDTLAVNKGLIQRILNHYKGPILAKTILKSGHFHASHLPSQSSLDSEEYYHFMRQIGHPLATGQPLPKKVAEYYSSGVMPIEQMRDDVYALCFTDDESNNFFWDNYAEKGTGVRFRLKYTPVTPNHSDDTGMFPLYHLRKMFYDIESNDRMSFINRMNNDVRDNIGYELMFGNVNLFATFYKRYGYTIENETRLSFDISYLRARNAYHESINIYNEGSRKFIMIPIKNRKAIYWNTLPFELELIEVICGKNMNDDDYADIERIVSAKYSNVDVSRM